MTKQATYTIDGMIKCEKCGHLNPFEVTGIEIAEDGQPLGEKADPELIQYIRKNIKKQPPIDNPPD